MQASIGYVNVHVRDFPRALAFYRDALGFPLEFSDDSFHYARFNVGGMPLAVASSGEEDGTTPEPQDRLTGVGFVVPDVDAAFRELKANGVRFTMAPSKQPWGGYMAMFADPDGNIFYLDGRR